VVLASVINPGMYLHTELPEEVDENCVDTELHLFTSATRFCVVPVAKHPEASIQEFPCVRAGDFLALRHAESQVRKTPSWPRNWANFSLL
jgi:hypothetical protein